jgi:hypothetical protein
VLRFMKIIYYDKNQLDVESTNLDQSGGIGLHPVIVLVRFGRERRCPRSALRG